ncbi:MAG TPA: NAD-glutamate dehydrogenase domain-containing protein, partial [Aeromicrobium sp.]|nr:NAD-glutamate dehydrogenase domain-containing protein [Aeromicrobium sp.]
EHFTFLGYREYELLRVGNQDELRPVADTGLGLLRRARHDGRSVEVSSRLSAEGLSLARDPQLLIITKANSRATVHRSEYLDYVGIKIFDDNGDVTGERRFLGLFTARAYVASVRDVPIIRERVDKVLTRAGLAEDSHSGKDLLEVIEIYPRDELFQTGTGRLYDVANAVLHLQERHRGGVFLRPDDYGRFVSCLVYLQRDRYRTPVRLAMENILRDTFKATTIDHTTRVTDAVLARIHFVIRVAPGVAISDFDADVLERRLLEATRTWAEKLEEAARAEWGEGSGDEMSRSYGAGLSEAYKEDFTPLEGLADLKHIKALESSGIGQLMLYRKENSDPCERRFKYFRHERVLLTDVLPVFTHLGVDIVDEHPYEVTRSDGGIIHIYDFGLLATSPESWEGAHTDGVSGPFQDAFSAVWRGAAESDGFNRLILGGAMTWRQVVILRAAAKYLRQIGSTFSQQYLEDALLANVDMASQLVTLFEVRFDPDHRLGTSIEERADAEEEIVEVITAGLQDVKSLDQDRIVRAFLGVIQGTLRTNYYQLPDKGYVSLKIDSGAVPGMPEPRPMCEVWVYSPRVEGVHLRFGKVARGGLRWSDRMEDFRTEVLGLVKAQIVKNAVIVPTGSKGGFVAKKLPDMSLDRDAWLAEGIAAYKVFVAAMLDVTDNLVDGVVVPPERVVRHDLDDNYLVVAADKGTAKFSDIANTVARSYDYWLDDAFASGGSAGYDHKAMGITARGAWESVRRHFREMGVDTQKENFTAVGIGDMSGDVFGNGLLRSEHTQLA